MNTFIIDDDNISIYLTKNMLKTVGVTDNIFSFSSADNALDFIKHNSSFSVDNIIFLDLNMPVMNGWEFLYALKSSDQHLKARCHIYLLTSSLDVSDVNRSAEYDMVYGYIHKPIKEDDVNFIFSKFKKDFN